MKTRVIPVLRMFDYAKAVEFYIDWLGFVIDWEHRFDDNAPLYMQISKGEAVFHLSEHHGDGSPGMKVIIETSGLKEYHAALIAKQYKYGRPGLEQEPWNALTLTLHDPFGNKVIFSEELVGS
jgi:uncharacterized glyoxalase superfamily protein PhnB